jgi:hypothetical protein
VVDLGDGAAVVVVNDVEQRTVEVRPIRADRPDRVLAPLAVYGWPDVRKAIAWVDRDSGSWRMLYRREDGSGHGIKVARSAPDGSAAP